jgi:hypothetical protein
VLRDERRIAKAVTGTAAGATSVIGFTADSDLLASSVAVLVSFPGMPGYRTLFGGADVVCALGCISA